MALNFPLNPTVGQTYQTGSSATYEFTDRNYWEIIQPSDLLVISASYAETASYALNSDGGGASVLLSASAPVSESLGTLWFNTSANNANGGELYILMNETSSNWVPVFDNFTNQAVSSSYALTASSAVSSSRAISSSFALTASHAPIFVSSSLPVSRSLGTLAFDTTEETLYIVTDTSGSWTVAGGSGGASVTISGSIPSGSKESGSLWWNEVDGNLYIQVNSPSGSIYVPATNTVAGGNYGATLTTTRTGSVWSINHNLNTTTPLVTVYSGSSVMLPEAITSVDANNTQITFSGSVQGTAVLSTGIGSATADLATTASFAITASFAVTASHAISASYALTASSAVSSSRTISSSFATTSSFVNPLNQNLIVTGSITSTSTLVSSNSSGDFGGSILLSKAQTNNNISGSALTIDTFQNRVRIYENGSPFRGGFFDITTLGANATTNLNGDTPFYIQASNNSGQTIPNLTTTTITGWTNTTYTGGSAWNNTTGVFTVPRTGYYRIRAHVTFATNTGEVGSELNVSIVVNGSALVTGATFRESNANAIVGVPPAETILFLNINDLVTVSTFQTTGAGLALLGNGNMNALTIQELPNRISR